MAWPWEWTLPWSGIGAGAEIVFALVSLGVSFRSHRASERSARASEISAVRRFGAQVHARYTRTRKPAYPKPRPMLPCFESATPVLRPVPVAELEFRFDVLAHSSMECVGFVTIGKNIDFTKPLSIF